jgi:hypothetical protein
VSKPKPKRAPKREDALAAATATVALARLAVARYLTEASEAQALEPGDVARLAGAAARLLSADCEAQARAEQRRQARLTRERTRVEIELARARVEALRDRDFDGLTDDELASVVAVLDRARKRSAVGGDDREGEP